jgi:3',5'-cyclic AMP phosphodiesterase CpdA
MGFAFGSTHPTLRIKFMLVLAHLSDPHLGPLPKPRLSELAGKRATGFLHWQHTRRLIHRGDVLARIAADVKTQKPDHIAVTGDLVNISLAGEYPLARAWLQSLGNTRDVTLVPGNHDAYVHGASAHPQLHWGDYMRGDESNEASFPLLRRREPLALIGLSSAVATAPLLSTGRLGAAQMARLAELLDQCRDEGLFRVVMVHHPPTSRAARYLKRLVDGAALRAVLASHGAELVIHGHDHAHSLVYLAGPQRRVPVLGVPSASQAPRGIQAAGYNLYRIEGRAGAWRCEVAARGLTPGSDTVSERTRIILTEE